MSTLGFVIAEKMAETQISLSAEPTDERAPSAGAKSLCIPFDQSKWDQIGRAHV